VISLCPCGSTNRLESFRARNLAVLEDWLGGTVTFSFDSPSVGNRFNSIHPVLDLLITFKRLIIKSC